MITKILALAVILALISIVTINYKSFLSLIIKLIFGKYSAKYYKLHKKLKGKYPYPISVKDNFIYYFRDILSPNTVIINSDEAIDFEDIAFLDSESTIKKKYGKPRYFSAIDLKHKAKVLGYSNYKNDLKNRNLFFLYDNLFIMNMKSYKDLNGEQKTVIKDQFCNHFRIQIPEESSFLVRDRNDNIAQYLDNGYAIRLKYFNSSNNDIYNALKNELAHYLKSGRK
jgi:hypothetical protein